MDNVTHTLFAATLARTPLGRAGRGATAALILSSNAPDIDIVTAVSGGLSYLQWHRGPTHGPLGIAGLGLVTAGLVWAGCRVADRHKPDLDRVQPARLALVSMAGVLLHILMDLPTSYGSRLLSPFDWHWYAVDLMPIIDLYLLTILAACLWFGRRGASLPLPTAGDHLVSGEARQSARRAGGSGSPARRNAALALILMVVNYAVRVVAHQEALALAPRIFGPTLPARCDAAVAQHPIIDRWPIHGALTGRDAARRCLIEIMALPSFASPFQWRLIAQLSNAYETREIDLVASRSQPAPAAEAPWRLVERYPSHWTPAVLQAAQSRTAQAFLGFSRLPAVRSRPEADGSTTVTWTDMRFSPGAPRTRTDRQRAGFFSITVRIGPDGRMLEERLGS